MHTNEPITCEQACEIVESSKLTKGYKNLLLKALAGNAEDASIGMPPTFIPADTITDAIRNIYNYPEEYKLILNVNNLGGKDALDILYFREILEMVQVYHETAKYILESKQIDGSTKYRALHMLETINVNSDQ